MNSKIIAAISIILIVVSCSTDLKENNENTVNALEPLQKTDSIFYVNEGTMLAKKMYLELLQQLQHAIDSLGYYESVRFCNQNAIPITDSVSKNFGIKAKRTSLKLRNPTNAPDSLEKQILLMYEKTQERKPVVIRTNDGIRFFTPIFIANFCLTCHGIPYQDIPDVTLKALDKWYPNDHARNYQLYDIRGIWSITFPNNYLQQKSITNKN